MPTTNCDEHGLEMEAKCADCGVPLCEKCAYGRFFGVNDMRVCWDCLEVRRDYAERLAAIRDERNRRLDRTLFAVARDMGRLSVSRLPES